MKDEALDQICNDKLMKDMTIMTSTGESDICASNKTLDEVLRLSSDLCCKKTLSKQDTDVVLNEMDEKRS